jgi:hypothetical protein
LRQHTSKYYANIKISLNGYCVAAIVKFSQVPEVTYTLAQWRITRYRIYSLEDRGDAMLIFTKPPRFSLRPVPMQFKMGCAQHLIFMNALANPIKYSITKI